MSTRTTVNEIKYIEGNSTKVNIFNTAQLILNVNECKRM